MGGTFYFFISVLDGYSRSIVHWEITEKMEEKDVEQVIQRALDLHPGVKPRTISDNGPHNSRVVCVVATLDARYQDFSWKCCRSNLAPPHPTGFSHEVWTDPCSSFRREFHLLSSKKARGIEHLRELMEESFTLYNALSVQQM